MVQHLIDKANLLVEEALPYIQKFKGAVFIIKYGGKAMINDELKRSVMNDVALLKVFGVQPVVVHGGGPDINAAMKAANLEPRFVDGLRVTDAPTLKIVRKVFRAVNAEIRENLSAFHVKSTDATGCIRATQKDERLGLVGDVTGVDAARLQRILRRDAIPVISTIGKGPDGYYNINADTAATAVAAALRAEKLTILTDVDGVRDGDTFVPHLTARAARQFIRKGVITGGMIPKVEACIDAVEAGCHKAHLINGTTRHALLFEIFTDEGVGTELVKA
jgi:acetylglutamate kinase